MCVCVWRERVRERERERVESAPFLQGVTFKSRRHHYEKTEQKNARQSHIARVLYPVIISLQN